MEVTAHRRVMMGKIEGLRVEDGNGGGGGGGGGGAVVPAPRTAGGSLVGVSVAHRLSAARTEIAALRGRLALSGGPVR
jgi:hypothetical protein